MRFLPSGRFLPALLLAGLAACRGPEPIPDTVVPNDNTAAAGTLHADTLTLRLVARRARWAPEADSGPSVVVAALAEDGHAPQVPAPMIRVREGTVIRVTLRNALTDSVLHVYGLRQRPNDAHDTLLVPPGDSLRVTFLAGAPGTYSYAAVLGRHDPDADDERETLAGAFIIDPRDGSPPDRVFVMNLWGDTRGAAYPNALAINGRSWPFTERIALTVGDTMRWRFINMTDRNHPMHLHGFFFTIATRGDPYADTVYAPEQRPSLVTEMMVPRGSMLLTTVPDRPGNWLFHCHIGFHVLPSGARLVSDSAEDAHAAVSPDAGRHMAGLVMGITIAPRPGAPPERARGDRRRLDLFVDEGVRRHQSPRTLGYVLQRGALAPARDSVESVGTPLLLTRGQPTDIVVHNRLPEPTAVHWHGIELESYSDGVPGWSGTAGRLAPMIPPGDSFVAHLTLPRAGTFIYHTHLSDMEQLTSGLYGAIIVTEPGHPFDPAHDHLFVAGWDGPDDPPHILVNGESTAEPLVLEAGQVHRLRIVSIGVAGGRGFALRRGGALAQWRAVAKDGWTLPAAQATLRPAAQHISAGETFDFEIVPTPGEYLLTAMFDDTRPAWHQRFTVR